MGGIDDGWMDIKAWLRIEDGITIWPSIFSEVEKMNLSIQAMCRMNTELPLIIAATFQNPIICFEDFDSWISASEENLLKVLMVFGRKPF